MGKKKSKKIAESDSDMGFDNNMDDPVMNLDDDDDEYNFHDENEDDQNDYDDDDLDEDDDNDHDDDEEGSEEDIEEGAQKDVEKVEEMEELEKEFSELKKEEQDILRNLKQHKDEDIRKGRAVKNQRALWDKMLEFRFLLQKPFSNSNRLPQEPVRSFSVKLIVKSV